MHETFGLSLKLLRKRAGLSQAEVAATLNVQQSTVAMWETGENMPRAAMLPRLARLYNCTIGTLYVFGREQKGAAK